MQPRSIKVHDLTTFTLLDYPDTPAAIIWLAGCNMRCPYCHNPDIVFGENRLDFNKVLDFLKKRRNLLEGVVISGGEPTLHKDILTIVKSIKKLGYKIKLDTNGSRPDILQKMIVDNLLDYVALDFKAPPKKYKTITHHNSFDKLLQTLQLLIQSNIEHEVRTTVHTDILDEKDIDEIIHILRSMGFKKTFYVQKFIKIEKTLNNLPDPKKRFDTNSLSSNGIQIAFRNFQ